MLALATDHACHSPRHQRCSHSCSTTIAAFHFTCCLTISSGDHGSPLLSGTKSPTPVRLQRATNRLDQVLTRHTAPRVPRCQLNRHPARATQTDRVVKSGSLLDLPSFELPSLNSTRISRRTQYDDLDRRSRRSISIRPTAVTRSVTFSRSDYATLKSPHSFDATLLVALDVSPQRIPAPECHMVMETMYTVFDACSPKSRVQSMPLRSQERIGGRV